MHDPTARTPPNRAELKARPPARLIPAAQSIRLTPLTPLVGRSQERVELLNLLGDPAVHAITILGPGGVGKTRLAQAVADDFAASNPAGVLLLRLETVREPDLVFPMVARAVGLREHEDWSALDLLASHFRDQPMLLVLDNVEQILGISMDVAELLRRCPGLTILTTSRTPLNISQEQLFHLSPLTVPDDSALPDQTGRGTAADHNAIATSTAVTLFVRRANAIHPGFRLTDENAPYVAAICRQLDGLPLAIELAAARCNVLSPKALAARLKGGIRLLSGGPVDAPERQRALASTIAWSYDLLNPQDQRLFRGLGAFANGCDLPAAEAVLAPSGSGDMLDRLSILVDNSLVRAERGSDDEPRFMMLETIREFALEQLRVQGEEQAVRARQFAWFLDLAVAANVALRQGDDPSSWLNRLEADHSNLRAALEWAIDHQQTEGALRLAAALWRFWEARGHLREGTSWLERTLAMPGDVPPAVRAQALNNLGNVISQYGDSRHVQDLYEESLHLRRAIDDHQGIADTLNNLAILLTDHGDYQRARAMLEESLNLRRALGDDAGLILAIANLGDVAIAEGNLDQAEQFHQQARSLRQARDDTRGIAYSDLNLGLVALLRRDPAAAQSRLASSLQTFQTLGDTLGTAFALHHLALVAHQSAQPATQLLLDALQLRVELGDRRGIAECLEGFAVIGAVAPGDAAKLLGAAQSLRLAVGIPLPAVEQPARDGLMTDLQAQLPDDAFVTAWAEGLALNQEDACLLARQSVAVREAVLQAEQADSPPAVLTNREGEILRLVAEGMTNIAIAERLFLSPRTVEAHLHRIYRKLDIPSRAAATRFAVERGLLDRKDA